MQIAIHQHKVSTNRYCELQDKQLIDLNGRMRAYQPWLMADPGPDWKRTKSIKRLPHRQKLEAPSSH